jgi:hypothetical protein
LALAEYLIKEGFILNGLHFFVEAEGEVWVELYLEGWLELVDNFGEEWWKIVCEGVFGCRRISIKALLQVLDHFFFELSGQRLHLFCLLLIEN